MSALVCPVCCLLTSLLLYHYLPACEYHLLFIYPIFCLLTSLLLCLCLLGCECHLLCVLSAACWSPSVFACQGVSAASCLSCLLPFDFLCLCLPGCKCHLSYLLLANLSHTLSLLTSLWVLSSFFFFIFCLLTSFSPCQGVSTTPCLSHLLSANLFHCFCWPACKCLLLCPIHYMLTTLALSLLTYHCLPACKCCPSLFLFCCLLISLFSRLWVPSFISIVLFAVCRLLTSLAVACQLVSAVSFLSCLLSTDLSCHLCSPGCKSYLLFVHCLLTPLTISACQPVSAALFILFIACLPLLVYSCLLGCECCPSCMLFTAC